ncbi:hypothetical protein [Metabacillus endolithicus]|uniref:Uncharacterized protein n=1 Tax=Metabacillus endolithicus TaxID=1535204 RepID=A0ABW5C5L8_9BACI|nr:hypothetical protein [Metabacillus endolithicus]UPG66047.1 hypothetical protein MVE64_26765 [Metabacillus endolithicus]
MWYVTYKKITNEKARVENYFNLDLVEKPEGVEGFEIVKIPTPPLKDGHEVIEFINPNTREFFYDFIPRPLSPEEKI